MSDSSVKAICAIYPPTQIRKYENTDPISDAYKALMGPEASQEEYNKASPLLQLDYRFSANIIDTRFVRLCCKTFRLY